MDKYDLYQLCVQLPETDIAVLCAIHAWFANRQSVASHPLVFSDEFAGPGALARQWVKAVTDSHAFAIDADPEPLERAYDIERVTPVCANVMDVHEKADIIAGLNFAICEWHARSDLLAYLKHARSRLLPHGFFACDLYVGSDSLMTGEIVQQFAGPDGEDIEYCWEQQHVDLLTNRVQNALHFVVTKSDGAVTEFPSAFEYDWRLWSIVELRDAMHEAGFAQVEVFVRDEIALDDNGDVHVVPASFAEDLDESDQVLVCATA
ncbi:MAG: hypothetical protein H6815_09310 [Phycisphaeraceae bacterium]|nr:hypothetical protein [Phycisphaerales bacterium]MCB9860635.1 hypothetical protein [Phycisphaeraceae bacterium]